MFTKFASLIITILVGLCIVLGILLSITNNKLDKEKLNRQMDQISYEKAQKNAEILSLKKVEEQRKEYEELRTKTDADYLDLINKFRSDIVRFKTTKGTTSTIYLPSTSEHSSGSPRAGENTLIPVPTSDLEICAENTAKALVASEWAKAFQH